jgi:hypothetical protein
VARASETRLREFKRELLNLGLDEAQVHEIIPDAGSADDSRGNQPKSTNPPANLPKAA